MGKRSHWNMSLRVQKSHSRDLSGALIVLPDTEAAKGAYHIIYICVLPHNFLRNSEPP